MTDYSPKASPGSSRWLAALVALAFVAGLTLMGYAARRWHWFDGGGSGATTATTARTLSDSLTPATATVPPAPAAAAPSPDPMTDTATLATREATLAGQLSSLEARTAQLVADAGAAAAQAGRAEALLVAVAARRQIDAGQPLGYLEERLHQRFGQTQPRAVALLIAAARQPTTLPELIAGLDALRPRLTMAPDDDFIDGLRRELATLVVLRRTGTRSPLPADRLDHAARLLLGGQVDLARHEVAALPGAAAATGWLSAARRWVAARQALDALDAAALSMPAPTNAVPTIVPPPTVTTVSP